MILLLFYQIILHFLHKTGSEHKMTPLTHENSLSSIEEVCPLFHSPRFNCDIHITFRCNNNDCNNGKIKTRITSVDSRRFHSMIPQTTSRHRHRNHSSILPTDKEIRGAGFATTTDAGPHDHHIHPAIRSSPQIHVQLQSRTETQNHGSLTMWLSSCLLK